MNKLSLPELRRKVVTVFQAKAYKVDCIKTYNYTWDKLQAFMDAHAYTEYTRDVGVLYLDKIHDRRQYSQLSPIEKKTFRHISVLTEVLETDTISLRSKPIRIIHFPGQSGEIFETYISEQSRIKRPKTIEFYRLILKRLNQFLADNETTIDKISIPLAIKYINGIDAPETSSVRRDTILGLRVFFRYLCSNHLLENNNQELWMSLLKVPPRSNRIPSIYTRDEVEQIISMPDRSTAMGKRDYAMVLLAARYGLRASDIIGLRFCNIDWENNQINIFQTKTSRALSLPLSEEVGCALIDYIKHGRPNIDLPYIFISATVPYKEITRSLLAYNISKWIKLAGINYSNRKRGPHALRHSLATNLMNINEPLPVISEILGHSTTQSTTTYIRVSYEQLRHCALDVPFVSSIFYENLYDHR